MGNHYCHLKLDERRKLAEWLEAKMPISEIVDRLGRDPSTIYRDIKRNRYTDTERMIVHPELKAAIEDRLKAGWSPEQIAGRMRLERHPIRVSHETIYRFAYGVYFVAAHQAQLRFQPCRPTSSQPHCEPQSSKRTKAASDIDNQKRAINRLENKISPWC